MNECVGVAALNVGDAAGEVLLLLLFNDALLFVALSSVAAKLPEGVNGAAATGLVGGVAGERRGDTEGEERTGTELELPSTGDAFALVEVEVEVEEEEADEAEAEEVAIDCTGTNAGELGTAVAANFGVLFPVAI